MKSRRRTIVLATMATMTLASLWVGCALAIDLGDEAKLRLDEAGIGAQDTGIDTNIVDSGVIDAPDGPAPIPIACGLERSPNEQCATCITAQCCDVSKTCAADPTCIAGFECIKDCMVQLPCIFGCLGNANPDLQAVTNCAQSSCSFCTPGPKCAALGSCGILFGDAGGDLIIRNLVRGLTLNLDEDKCAQQQQQMFRYSDAAACQPNP